MKVLIVDDHPLARKGICAILEEKAYGYELVEAADKSSALEAIHIEQPAIVILDLKLGGEDGLLVAEEGKLFKPDLKFILLTSFISHANFLRAEVIGIDGYILKDVGVEDLGSLIEIVSRGKKYYDPEIVKYLRGDDNNLVNQLKQLTEREKEVLLQVGRGLANDEIARQLYLSVNTVKKHVSSILLKLNLERRTQLALLVNEIKY